MRRVRDETLNPTLWQDLAIILALNIIIQLPFGKTNIMCSSPPLGLGGES